MFSLYCLSDIEETPYHNITNKNVSRMNVGNYSYKSSSTLLNLPKIVSVPLEVSGHS